MGSIPTSVHIDKIFQYVLNLVSRISNIQKGGKFSLLKRAFTYDEAAYEGPVTLLIAVKAE